MSAALKVKTLADLMERLGEIPLDRVRFQPPPGTATERDVIAIKERENRTSELIDRVIVEKATGIREALLATWLVVLLRRFIDPRNLGLVTGPDGMLRLFPGLVRAPDVAFISWSRVPGGRIPEEPVPDLVPDLAVEVLSQTNTPKEMARKRREYFKAGVRLVWMVDIRERTVTVFTAPDQSEVLNVAESLDCGAVLPGFTLALSELFADLDRHGPEET